MKKEEERLQNITKRMVPISSIVIAVIAFGVGAVFILLLNNFFAREKIILSTQSIASLVFTAALGAASIVLAVIAISISRNAQEALIRRSEEGIRIQNEVFVRTSEVLSRIQASTGVTEKRIEDIISGRTGVIAKQVVESSLAKQEPRLTDEITEKITNAIADSLKHELLPLIYSTPSKVKKILEKKEAEQKRKKEIGDKWDEFRKSIIDKLKEFREVKVISEGTGDLSAEDSSKFWDAVLEIESNHISIDTHIKDQIDEGVFMKWRTDELARINYLKKITWRIQQDAIDLAFIVFDKDVWKDDGIIEIARMLDEFNERYSKSRIIRLSGDSDYLAKQIHSISLGNE